MSDDVETKSDSETKSGRKPLSLRRTETGAVKQSFSHGRSKTVVVETKRRRVLTVKKDAAEGKADTAKPAARKAAPKTAPKAAPKAADGDKKKPNVLRTLSEGEKQARAAALIKARQDEEVRKKAAEAERVEREKREAEERERLELERKKQAAEEAKRKAEAEERKRHEEEARKALARSGTLAGFVVMTPEELDEHHALQNKAPTPSMVSRIMHALTGWF